ncbi:MAG: DUF1489 domain-containing protein [Erythrobacter sp.]
MPLHMTKIAFGANSVEDLAKRFEGRDVVRLTTRYRPKRHEELIGGSLYWIVNHALVARSTILGFPDAEDGRCHIELEPVLVRIHPKPKRAHQGWRYLKGEPPRDLAPGEDIGDALPGRLAAKLEKLALI